MRLIQPEALYQTLPVWAQNLALSLYGLGWRHERLGGSFNKIVRDFRERSDWSEAEMQTYQTAQLRRVLLEAWDLVPYYKERWSAAGLRRPHLGRFSLHELSCIPITSRQDLRSDPEAFVASTFRGSRGLRRYRSSGSSGTPIESIYNPEVHRRFIAAREARSFNWAGVSIRSPRAMIGGRLVVPPGSGAPFYRYNRAEQQVYFSAFHLGPATVGNYVEGLNRFQPIALTGYAHSYYVLARLMREQSLSLTYHPSAIILSSEKITSEMRTIIEQAFGAPVFEEYGCIENCVLATQCAHGALHASPDFGIMEIVDADGHPVAPGSVGSIVGTSLLNEVQYLIRYEVGDYGVWSRRACSCGKNHLPVVEEVIGRSQDVIFTASGNEVQMLQAIFITLQNVREAQIVQESLNFIRVRVVANAPLKDSEKQILVQKLTERLGHMNIEIEETDFIERTERGKFRPVVSKLTEEDVRKARAVTLSR